METTLPRRPGRRRSVPLLLMLAMFPANVYAARMPNPPKSMTSRLDVRTAKEVVYLATAMVVAVAGG
jgi:uncharacterized membrane protein